VKYNTGIADTLCTELNYVYIKGYILYYLFVLCMIHVDA